jgi:CTP synthase (UTP-ammonia lyase)
MFVWCRGVEMTTKTRVALVGDYNPAAKAHQGIPRALALACEADRRCEWEWVHTSTLLEDPSEQLAAFHAVWCVPASPYANTRGALAAIRFARETGRVFLGTCGGFQHALLEYAEAVWGVAQPAHAELQPDAAAPVIAPLACALVEVSGEVHFDPGSRLAAIYGAPTAFEQYHCQYGLSPACRERLASGPLRLAGRDDGGDVRAIELDGHPFFVATLYQPERSALAGRRHPLVRAFVAAAQERAAAWPSLDPPPKGRSASCSSSFDVSSRHS